MGRHGRLQHHADTRESGLSRRNTPNPPDANSVCLHRPRAAVVHPPPAIAATASPYRHGPVVVYIDLLLDFGGAYTPLGHARLGHLNIDDDHANHENWRLYATCRSE
jgi:hypothetical protein